MPFPALAPGNTTIAESADGVNMIAMTWSSRRHLGTRDGRFIRQKMTSEITSVDVDFADIPSCIDCFIFDELKESLAKTKYMAPGIDLIHNVMLKDLRILSQR